MPTRGRPSGGQPRGCGLSAWRIDAVSQLTPAAPWRVRVDQALRDRIRPEVPDGWLPLDQAAHALGLARQTVLHKVQRGELAAIQITSGKRKGLRVNVKPDQPGLFDNPR